MRFKAWAAAAVFTTVLGCGDDTSGDDESTNGQTQAGSQTETGDSSDSSSELGCAAGAVGETTDGATEPLMNTWGSACQTDEDCVPLLGAGAICEDAAVVYELPGGYCTKPCVLPDTATRVVMDDPMCDPAGGVACIGQKPQFERCTKLCSDDNQCNRDGYICRQMPLIAQPEDPTFCLMPDCCSESCQEG